MSSPAHMERLVKYIYIYIYIYRERERERESERERFSMYESFHFFYSKIMVFSWVFNLYFTNEGVHWEIFHTPKQFNFLSESPAFTLMPLGKTWIHSCKSQCSWSLQLCKRNPSEDYSPRTPPKRIPNPNL